MVYRDENIQEENGLSISNEHNFPNVSTEDVVSKKHNKDVEPIPEELPIEKELFEDPDFPANSFSLYRRMDKSGGKVIEWKRPKEIMDNPKFFVDGFSRFDVRQGYLGDCWFLASCASLANVPELFVKVVPKENVEFDADNYEGKYHFRFWRYGEWVTIVVDDRLPVDGDDELKYGQTSTEYEFWFPLLEKAYAKLHGSYEALGGGFGEDGMVDLTGGLKKCYILEEINPKELFTMVERSLQQKCLITAGTHERPELKKVNIFGGHEYTVTKIKPIQDDVKFICIRNPWGEGEWNGPWSDKSTTWKVVSDEKIAKLNVVKEDGEFWMEIKHFVKYFVDISICYQSPNDFAESQNQEESFWTTVCQDGKWIRDRTAGGSDEETFYMNPQYLITLENHMSNDVHMSNEVEKSSNSEKSFNTIIGLMQKYGRALGRDDLSIALAIFSVPKGMDLTQRPLPKSFFDNSEAINDTSFVTRREIIFNKSLSAGKYVLVPYTWKPQQEADFFVRVISEGDITLTCMNQIDEAYITTD
ncbi:calpain-A-like [Anopheles ziemanni]|uniref:calpain-A-like n=1 Tax=Anopheles coustani TaxID=139045 RepID=UPI002659418D|nr:calpain-A-like [Anopheles coustani]XP_058178124.1 calpain-A-like [Anopheles ziemanni]